MDNKVSEVIEKWNKLTNEAQIGLSSSNTLFPVAIQLASKTIGLDLVSVQPMDYYGLTKEERERLESEIKQENRDNKIDSYVDGKEYIEKSIKDHPDYKPGPKMNLMYLDFVYGSQSNDSEI